MILSIDIGSVSAKAAITDITTEQAEKLLQQNWTALDKFYLSPYIRTKGLPVKTTLKIIKDLENIEIKPDSIHLTGGGAKLVSRHIPGCVVINEFKALAAGTQSLGIEAKTIFEMGGETSKYLRLAQNDWTIEDYSTNGDCAAGTGSFIDQQASRLKYTIEEIGPLADSADRTARIAGRCSVFAKSDMIHAQQKGYNPSEVMKGLCQAVARNFRAAVIRSHKIETPIAFTGGVALNHAVTNSLKNTFDLEDDQIIVPENCTHIPAIGACVCDSRINTSQLEEKSVSSSADKITHQPLSMDNVLLLRDQVKPFEDNNQQITGYLGIDIGSVSTNVVVIDTDGKLVTEIYTRTQGRPIEVVSDALKQIESKFGSRLEILSCGTTGSGRELVGKLIGADTINDEITAHKTGAAYVGNTMLDGKIPDTIFEIGGQDSKYISLQDGIVIDFTMNDACAAGTGSFLEERAEELEIPIKGVFADLALKSESPIRLGERCTVFMQRDVTSHMQHGADKSDLVAGLAYSVVLNYINRVVRGRKIGDVIFFQGGTAYNDSVAAAFAQVTGKQIIVPPHNGVIGAIGVALLAREKHQHAQNQTSFRGFDLSKIGFELREFTCKSCSNHCDIQEFTVEGVKTYWGDKCSTKFRTHSKPQLTPVIDDLFDLREKLLADDSELPKNNGQSKTVGIPLTMFALDQLPFWRTMLANMGFKVILSDPTNSRIVQDGLASVVAEPCFPIISAHGHIAHLGANGADYILVPNTITLEAKDSELESHLCPWHQTLPFVTRKAPALEHAAHKFMTPLMHFQDGKKAVTKTMVKFFADHGISAKTVKNAVNAGYDAWNRFKKQLIESGKNALEKIHSENSHAVIIVGRPYNVHDVGMNLSLAGKLRKIYGINCIPLDMLDLDAIDTNDVNSNMYWTWGQKILAAAKFTADKPNLHIIHITNFKCGPDSFIRHFIQKAAKKPHLTLQLDGHSNDAGMITRCEAYLDSKGILRPWRTKA